MTTSRFKATYKDQVIGWFDTLDEARDALDDEIMFRETSFEEYAEGIYNVHLSNIDNLKTKIVAHIQTYTSPRKRGH